MRKILLILALIPFIVNGQTTQNYTGNVFTAKSFFNAPLYKLNGVQIPFWSPNSNNIYYSLGNVGIKKLPSYELDVNGTINATNIYKNGTIFSFNTSFTGSPTIDNAINSQSLIFFRSASSARWSIGKINSTETGGNNGASFAIYRYNDAGSVVDRPFYMRRVNGFLGLGTESPIHRLHVSGGIASDTLKTNILDVVGKSSFIMPDNTATSFKISGTSEDDYLSINTGSTGQTILIDENGMGVKVGIGTSNPTKSLYVNGTSYFRLTDDALPFTIYDTKNYTNALLVSNQAKTMIFDDSNIGYKIGIGTNVPTHKLDMTGDPRFIIPNNVTRGFSIEDNSDNSYFYVNGQNDEVVLGYGLNTKVGVGTYNSSYKFDVNGTSRFGTSSNYTSTESDGTLVFTGDATVFDDVSCNLLVGGATTPTATIYNGGVLRAYEYVGSSVLTRDQNGMIQLPHSYKEGSNVTVHVHLYIPNDVTGGTIKMSCTYTWANINSTSAISETTITGTVIRTAGQGISNNAILSFPAITGTGKTISSIIAFRLLRDAGDASDTFGSSVWVKSIDAHFEKDTEGSRTETTK